METTYHTSSGQKIRQNQDLGINNVVIEKKKTNYVEKSQVFGQDSYTNQIWSEDIDYLKRWVRDWAHYPDEIYFEVINN